MDKKIEMLDWGIIVASIIMLFMIYIPKSIWNEEIKIRNEARHRMLAISNAQEFYKELQKILNIRICPSLANFFLIELLNNVYVYDFSMKGGLR